MTSVAAREHPSPPKREYHPLPAFLSYLVPGLGQIYQGRVAKGILFFVCVLTLFYYGMFMGSWSNVYLPSDDNKVKLNWLVFDDFELPRWAGNVWMRPQYAVQVWVGVAAWPAIIQYNTYNRDAETGPVFGSYQRMPYETRELRQEPREPKQEQAGDSPEDRTRARQVAGLKSNVALNDWKGKTLNDLQTEGDKAWDLGWVFTVIAGALNIMVIYDALAGPAFVVVPEPLTEAKV